MTFWRTHTDAAPPFALNVAAGKTQYGLVAALGAIVVLAAFLLFPRPLFLPALGLLSFAIACASALFVRRLRIDDRASVTAGDVAALFTLMWIGAAIGSDPAPVIDAFAHFMTKP